MAGGKVLSSRKNRGAQVKRATEIRKGDMVQVIAGNDKGKVGKVIRVFPKRNRVLVEKVNFVKRHTKARRQGQQGGILEKEASIHLSNVLLFDPKSDRGSRVRVERRDDGRVDRIAARSGESLGRA
ncbi:MAG TPA: 50S ribosomal protein L24 [Candidatus Eisenbacteria bacterium]|jgi:large subunit ribosomal protein L24|nr:50S ribosomal protein L24 [Candidatus Eisenbacteria bacterium]